MNGVHQPVLLAETVSLLKPGEGKVIVDATVGGGGHSEALLSAGASVFAVDRDPRALERARRRLEGFGTRFSAALGNYADLEEMLERAALLPVDGILLDLGLSSDQLEDPNRGFSFQHEGPLDMRMSDSGMTAAELIASLDEAALASLIWRYGEERFARPIARMLKRMSPTTTSQAVEAIRRGLARKPWPKKIHPATKTFQALRIAVNQELEALDRFLSSLSRLLKVNGVTAVISFHSLEDRKVKDSFRALQSDQGSFRVLTKKPIVASPSERKANPRSRSARLRAVEHSASPTGERRAFQTGRAGEEKRRAG